MAGRASIVGAAATHVGKVRDHNEDAHFLDPDLGLFIVCDGMGGHAAGEVASAMAIRTIRTAWSSESLQKVADKWLESGAPEARRLLLDAVRIGVVSAHDAILAEAQRDTSKTGMGTTIVGAMIVGGELLFAHAGDSRAYLVRDGISMQLTEDHTLLARLLAAGIDVDVSGEGSRFRCMLTNALGIGEQIKVSTFVVPLADGDRFLLCSDGISEYVPENEVGEVLTKQPSPARAAQKLIDLALERGGNDNATALVVRVLEAGETPLPAEQRKRDDAAILACPLWTKRVTPQQRLRALRIAIPRDHNAGETVPAHALGDRVAWVVLDGTLVQDGEPLGPGALIYPESLLGDAPMPDRGAHAITRSDVRALAIRADDFRELCEDDSELGEALLENLAAAVAERGPRNLSRRQDTSVDAHGPTDPELPAVPSIDNEGRAIRFIDPDGPDGVDARGPTDPRIRAVDAPTPTTPRPRTTTAPRTAPGRAPGNAIDHPDAYRPTQPNLTVVPDPPPAEPPARPSPSPRASAADAATLRRPSTPIPVMPKTPLPSLTRTPPRGIAILPVARGQAPPLARSKTPPTGTIPPAIAQRPGRTTRPPTEPEIETYYEPDVEEPVAGPPIDDDDDQDIIVVRTLEDGDARITETVIETGSQVLTLTVTELAEEEHQRSRAITAGEHAAVSGTISIEDPGASAARRQKRISDGWED